MTDTRVSNIVRFSLFQANLRTGELCKAGLRVRIQEQPLKILAALLEKPNEVVTREELRQRIWPRESFGDFHHAIDLAVGKLRTALGDSAGTPRFIETLPRRGYRFIAPISTVVFPEVAHTDSAPGSSTSGAEPVPTHRDRILLEALGHAGCDCPFACRDCCIPLSPQYFCAASRIRSGRAFREQTGEPALDGTLEYAMQRELSNSGFLQVVPPQRVDDVLRLMKKPVNTPLDEAMAKEVCLRDGTIQELVTGEVEKLGSVYLLSATIVDPLTGTILQSVSEEANSTTAISPAVRRLSNQVRNVAGESLAQIKESNARLEQATTPSLRALQLYSRGMMFVNEERWVRQRNSWNKLFSPIPILLPLMSTWPIAIPMWARADRPTCILKERSNSETQPQIGSGISFSGAITTT